MYCLSVKTAKRRQNKTSRTRVSVQQSTWDIMQRQVLDKAGYWTDAELDAGRHAIVSVHIERLQYIVLCSAWVDINRIDFGRK